MAVLLDTSVLGRLTELLMQSYNLGTSELAVPLWRMAGIIAVGVVAVLLWVYRVRFGALYALGLALTALAVLGPSIRPWYLLWGLVPIAAAAPEGLIRRWAPIVCAVFASPTDSRPETIDAPLKSDASASG